MEEETPLEETPPKEVQTVPYERFAQKIEQVKNLEAALSDAKKTLEAAGGWEEKHNALTTTIEGERTSWAQKSALYEAGITDPDLAELARWRFEKSGSENFGEWLGSGAKEDSMLKPHFNKAPTPDAAPTAPTPTPTAPTPTANAGTRTAPPPRGEFTPESVQSMTIDELKANYGKIAGAWGYTARDFK